MSFARAKRFSYSAPVTPVPKSLNNSKNNSANMSGNPLDLSNSNKPSRVQMLRSKFETRVQNFVNGLSNVKESDFKPLQAKSNEEQEKRFSTSTFCCDDMPENMDNITEDTLSVKSEDERDLEIELQQIRRECENLKSILLSENQSFKQTHFDTALEEIRRLVDTKMENLKEINVNKVREVVNEIPQNIDFVKSVIKDECERVFANFRNEFENELKIDASRVQIYNNIIEKVIAELEALKKKNLILEESNRRIKETTNYKNKVLDEIVDNLSRSIRKWEKVYYN